MSFKQFLNEYKQENKCYIFDVDNTILTTDSKIYVLSNGEVEKSLTPEEFNTYKLEKGQSFNFDDFRSSEVLHNTGKKTPYWKIAQNVNDSIKRGTSKSEMYILTARPKGSKNDLFTYLKKMGLSELKMKNVYTLGDRHADLTIAQLKKISLKQIKKHHTKAVFFDDDTSNIELAKELKNIDTRLVVLKTYK